MTAIGSPERPLRVAIVGAGPAGFFAAATLLKSDASVRVDLYERIPAPFGLVRYGVAPDHPKIKRVQGGFERTLSDERVRHFGNVDVGGDVSVDALRSRYDGVILTVGASSDRQLGIAGEELEGSWSATEFVGWYNGHPDFQDREFALDRLERAVIVGVGNVAIDVARVLVRDRDELRATDITARSVEGLGASPVSKVVLLGRRGAAQAKFSPSEIKELGALEGVDLCADATSKTTDPVSAEWLERQSERGFRRNSEFVGALPNPTEESARSVELSFLTSPVEILGDDEGRVRGVRVCRNRLEPDGEWPPRPVGTDESWEIPCQAVFRSVGYQGVAVPGVPFDERSATVPNDHGRVLEAVGGAQVPGLYTAGWIKRGPSGLIGTNKADAIETVRALLADLEGAAASVDAGWDASVVEFLEGSVPCLFRKEDWASLDAVEIASGEAAGKPREKATSVEQMLRAVKR